MGVFIGMRIICSDDQMLETSGDVLMQYAVYEKQINHQAGDNRHCQIHAPDNILVKHVVSRPLITQFNTVYRRFACRPKPGSLAYRPIHVNLCHMAEKLTDQEVRRVAKLSRLLLSDDEVARFGAQLSNVLDYFTKLSELDVEDVQPMAHAADVTNVLREDVPKDGLSTEAALANAPVQMPPFFKVPKVLGEGSGA